MRGAAMSLSAAASGFVVFLLSVSVVQGQDGWAVTYTPTEICALRGSTVDMRCTYTYPSSMNGLNTTVERTFWFVKVSGNEHVDLTTDPQYSGRVQYWCYEKSCTLRITDLRESDSAEYKFRFITNQPGGRYSGSPGVTLSVTAHLDVQVKVSRSGVSQSSNWAELKCHSRCPRPERLHYIWYKNGQKIEGQTSRLYSVSSGPADSFSCAVEGYEAFRSPPVLVQGQDGWAVTYTPTEICALRGSTVDMRCTYTYPSRMNGLNTTVERTFWFVKVSGNEHVDLTTDPQYSGRVDVQCGDSDCTLRITDLRESDSAEYKFMFITNQPGGRFSASPGVTLSVTDPDLQVQMTTYWFSSWAELTCHSSCRLPAHPSYVWYKNGEKIETQTSSSYSGYFDDVNSYSCAVAGHEDSPSPPVCVRGQSCNKVTYADRRICAVKGSSVDISCTYNSYEAIRSKLWFSPGRSLQWQSPSQLDSQHRVQVLDEGGGRSTLRISDLRESDSAEYRFTFTAGSFEWGRSLPATTLTVTDVQVQVSRISVSQSYTEAELKCHSSCSPAARLSYVWFRNGTKISGVETSSYKDGFYVGDVVSCALKGHEDYVSASVYGPKLPSVSVSPSAEIVEGSSVTLSCSSDANPAANYTWYKTNGNGVSFKSQLVFSSIQSSDSGQYYCTAENELGRTTSESISVDVKYGPKLPSVSVSPSAEIVEGSSVTLSCSSDANPAANYTWYKENEDSPKASGQNFTITDVRAEHSGNYSCEAQNIRGHRNSTLHLTVTGIRSGVWKSAISGAAPAVFLAVLWLSVFLLIRRRRTLKQCSQPGERLDNREQHQSEEENHLHYASIHFTKNQTEPLYSNIRPAGARRHEEGERVEYAAVRFNSASAAPRPAEPGSGEDPSALYMVQGQDGWAVTYTPTEICALRGSTVDMRCTYTYPSRMNGLKTTVEEATWFVKMSRNEPVDLTTDPQYSGRVDVQCGDNDCTLRITDLRESDSAEYKFRFITNQPRGRYSGRTGVTLSVTDLQVKKVSLTDSYGFPSEALKCHSSCRLPDNSVYIWYKNGHKIQEETLIYSGDFDPADSYSCAIKGNEDFPSPSMCVRGQSCNKVTYTDRRICAFKGSSVDISCIYNSYNSYESIRSKFWFSPGRSLQWQSPSQPEDLSNDSQYSGRVQILTWKQYSTLRISDLRESDSAEYRFTFTAGSFEWGRSLPATTLTVTDPDLQVQVTTSSSSSWAKLTCHSSCRLPAHLSFVWYRNGEKIQKQTSSSYSRNFGYADSYSCAVAGHEDSPSPPVCVRGQYCNKVTYADRRICAVKGSSVDISCTYNSYYSYNRYIRSKLWFSPGRNLQWQSPSQLDSQRRVQVLDEGGGRSTLRISDLRESDSAEYRFTFTAGSFEWGRSLPATTLTVTALQVQVTSKRVHQHYTEAELKCQSSCGPTGRLSYVWFKNRVEIKKEESSSYKSRFYPRDFVFCALKGHEAYSLPSVYGPKLPYVSVSPSAEIVEGSSVTLSCSSDANPAANYAWYKTNGNGVSFKSQLVFRSIQSSDSGQYYCTAENELGRTTSESISVDVKYGPKLPSVSVSPSAEIVEGSSVTLSCSSDANPAANYIWYKENEDSPKASGQKFTITDVRAEHSGNYSCEAQNIRGSHRNTLHLTVVAGAWRSISAGITTAVILAVVLFFLFKLTRKKRVPNQSSDPTEKPHNRERYVPTRGQPDDQQDDLHYASVHFSTNHTDCLYSNIRPAGLHRDEQEREDESIDYAVVKFNRGSKGPRTQKTPKKDSAELYSTINKSC
uniref:titin-like n=1 Tax=Scatophagus argus TaxID=75038 RepID=UPI001ED7D60D|nr:titin-like [Scatophagus argus]